MCEGVCVSCEVCGIIFSQLCILQHIRGRHICLHAFAAAIVRGERAAFMFSSVAMVTVERCDAANSTKTDRSTARQEERYANEGRVQIKPVIC